MLHFNGLGRAKNPADALHVVERFTRTRPDAMRYAFTVEDTATWEALFRRAVTADPEYVDAHVSLNVMLLRFLLSLSEPIVVSVITAPLRNTRARELRTALPSRT